jgi:hypothetical protein
MRNRTQTDQENGGQVQEAGASPPRQQESMGRNENDLGGDFLPSVHLYWHRVRRILEDAGMFHQPPRGGSGPMDDLNVNSDGGRLPQALTHFSQESIFLFTLRPGWCGLCGAALMVHLERPRVRPDLRWRLRIHSDEITFLRGNAETAMIGRDAELSRLIDC